MNELYQPIAALLSRVRTRWRRLVLLRKTTRAAMAAAAVLLLVLMSSRWVAINPAAEAIFGVAALGALIGAALWGMRGVRGTPSDARIARFIEERHPELDERLVSAVGVATAPSTTQPTLLAASMMADAARAAGHVDPETIVLPEALRRAALTAAGAVAVLAVLAVMARGTARSSFDALTLALFPSHIVLEVTPGDARVEAGTTFTVRARLVGNRAAVVAQLLRAAPEGGDDWRATPMDTDDEGRFSLTLNALATSFRYRVSAGSATSKTFAVAVVRAPRVTRIDVEYTYPKSFGLQNRVETDGGDIYAPAGTDVRVHVHTDRPSASGRLLLADGQPVDLTLEGSDKLLTGALTIASDSSYRVGLADHDGLSSRGDTEYFIRTLEDRPPEVHVVRPASDRRVTPLEEVDIEAEAQDDFGIASLELVYSRRGEAETVVPLKITPQQTSAVGRQTLFLEDLGVRPGDFISYYVRARDIPRGKRPSEARSDIFFLEVKPFEEEFTLAQSQAMMGGGQGGQQLDDLVAAQKEVIVATWKLDRRSRASNGAKSEQDIRAISKAELELKTKVEQASSAFRQTTMRDPRARPNGRGVQPPRAGQTMPEEDAMTVASGAMGRAVEALDALSTANAVTPEMEALNALLKAQSDIKKRQIQQQAGSGAGGNRNIQDLSSLFDKELARHQQTNYETKNSAESQNDQKSSALDQIKDLARRQDELARRQEQLAKNRAQMSEEERQRALSELTREQNELVQRAEALAEQMRQQNQSGQQNQGAQQNQQGSPQNGQQSQSSGQPGQTGPQNRPGQSGDPRPGQQSSGRPGSQGQGNQMRDIAEEMRRASGDLRRDDAAAASERSSRVRDRLRDLEQQLQNASPDGQRRALGDLQLEARQLADAERQIASEAGRGQPGAASADNLRRLSAEQQRLADRVRQMQQQLDVQAAQTTQPGQAAGGGKDGEAARNLQQAAGDASRELQRQRVAERMEQSADAMRNGAERGGSARGQTPSAANSPSAAGSPAAQEDIARTLDRLADRLASASRAGDDESRRLSDQLTRAQELRERMDALTGQLEQLGRTEQNASASRGGASTARGTQATSERAAGNTGRSGQGQDGAGGSGNLDELRAELNRQLQQVRDLLAEAQKDEGTQLRGGVGRTFEGQGMTLSAPGTEAFKQDFAKWQELKRQATAALEHVESSLAERLQAKDSKDRLAAPADEAAPAGYERQVDSYFKALATRKP